MINDEIVDYIAHELTHGTSESEIRRALTAVGWQDADITENFAAARQRQSMSPVIHENEPKEKRAFLKKHSKAVIVMSIVGLLLAGAAFGAYKYILVPSPEKMLGLASVNMNDVKSMDFSGRITADVTTPDNIFNLQAFLPNEILNQISDKRVAGAATNLQLAIDFKGTLDGSDEKNAKADMDLDVSSGIFTIGMKLRVIGNIFYVNFDQIPKITEEIDKYSNTWIKIDSEAISKQYGLGVDFNNSQPNLTEGQKKQIEELTKTVHLYNSVTRLPNDVIDGMTMYRYSVVVDKFGLKNYLKEIDKINKSAGGLSDTSLDELDGMQFKNVEVWIGKSDRMPHRISMQISQAASNDSIPSGSVNLLLNFSNFNNSKPILAPTGSKNIQDIITELMSVPPPPATK